MPDSLMSWKRPGTSPSSARTVTSACICCLVCRGSIAPFPFAEFSRSMNIG
jgi:hypothetical protein